MQRIYNWKRDPVDDRDFKSMRHLKLAAETLPSKFELDRNIPVYDQGNIGSCFRGDTEIRLLNGTVRTLADLVNEPQPFWVYSCDTNGSLVPGKAKAVLTGRNKETIIVTLDSGEQIICTPNHEFMLRDGSYKKAIDLTTEDSLMPNYLNYDRGYERYFDNHRNKWVYTHTRINEFFNSVYKTESLNRIRDSKDKYLITHHKNFNKFDNTPENLEWMGEIEHASYHRTSWNGTEAQRAHARKNALWQHKNMPGWSNPSKGGRTAWENAQDNPKRLQQILNNLELGRAPEARKKAAAKSRITITNRSSDRKREISQAKRAMYESNQLMQEACRNNGKQLGGQKSNEFQCARLGSEVLLKYGELNEENWNIVRDLYVEERQQCRVRDGKKQVYVGKYNCKPRFQTAMKVFGSFENLLERSRNYNHKIAKIEPAGNCDVYCLQVEEYHNFAVKAGVFVHNCTANSGCACYRYELAQLIDNFDFDLSRLYLYYNTRILENTINEDSGAYIRTTFKALNKWGLAYEQDFPYEISKFKIKPSEDAYDNGKKNIVIKYSRVDQDESALKRTLMTGAAISFGFNVYESFDSGKWWYTTGLMPIPKQGEKIIGGHACFTKDTKISLLDGREVTIEYLLKEYSDKTFYVYSYDIETNKIVPGLAHSPRKTGEMQKILKVVLDNGETIKCTENHPFLMRNGEYKEAKDLHTGDSLMPLYRKLDERGYEMFLENKKWKYTHRYMVDWKKKNSKDHTTVHHIDFNKRNNSPDNLQLMTWDDHTKLHNTQTILLNEYAKSSRGREKSRELMLAHWADPVWKENRLKQNSVNGKTTSKKLKEEGRCGFQSKSKEELSAHGKQYIKFAIAKANTPEALKKRSETIKRRMLEDFEFAEKKREHGRNNWKKYNEMYRNGEIILTEEQLENRRLKNINNFKKITPDQRWLAQKRTTYKRFYRDVYDTFDDYMADKYPNNHKVVSIEEFGYEDVYDITVEKYHNFALSSGIFVHNCTITGWDDSKNAFLIQNSWGTNWGLNGKFWMPYSFILNRIECGDFWCIEEIESELIKRNDSELKTQLQAIFQTKKHLSKLHEDVIVRVGLLLELDVHVKYNKSKNVDTVSKVLELE